MSYFSVSAPESAIKYNYTKIDEINKIAKPLLENFGITLVTYRRFFNNGDLLHLSNDLRWLDHSNKYNHWTSHSTLDRIASTSQNNTRAFIWEKTPNPNDSVYGALYEFDLWNGVTIYEKNENSTEVWAFSGNKEDPSILDIYTNHMDILKRFMLYFQDKAKNILDTTDKSKIISADLNLITLNSEDKNKKIINFIKATEIKNYFLKEKDKDFSLSKRQAQCLFYLAQGKSIKEIASLLDDLSPRTIESYLINIKEKTGYCSNATLLNKHLYAIQKWIF